MDAATLKKIKRYYQGRSKVPPSRANEEDLVFTVSRQFALVDPPNPDEIIEKFIAAIKNSD